MAIDQVVSLFATLTLIEMIIALGLGAEASAVLKTGKSWDLIVPAFFASRVIVPGAALGLTADSRQSNGCLAEFQDAVIDLHGLSARLQGEGADRSVKSWNEPTAVIESAALHNSSTLRKAG